MESSFLAAGVPGVQAPDILGLAGKGITLADMMQKNQMNDLALRTQQAQIGAVSDPHYLSALGLNAAPGTASYGQPSGPDLAALISRFPEFGPTLLKSAFEMQKQQADIAEAQQKAAEAKANALAKNLEPVQGFAAVVAKDPSVQNVSAWANAMRRAGLDIDAFGPLPASGDATAYKKYFGEIEQGLMTAPNRLAFAAQAVNLPLTAAHQALENTGQAINNAQAPQKLANETSNAAATASNAAVTRGNFFQPKPVVKPGTSEVSYEGPTDFNGGIQRNPAVTTPAGGIGSPPVAGAGATGAPSGMLNPAQLQWAQQQMGTNGPVDVKGPNDTTFQQGGMPAFDPNMGSTPIKAPPWGSSPGALKMNEALAPKVAEIVAEMPQINSAYNRFAQFKQQLLNEKNLTGPIYGSEGFQHFAGLISQLPGMSDEARKVIANTQVTNAVGLAGVFNLLGENKGSVPRSTTAMEIFIHAKPGTQQYREAALNLTDALMADLRDRVSLATNLQAKMYKNEPITWSDMPANTNPAMQQNQPAAANGALKPNADGTYTWVHPSQRK